LLAPYRPGTADTARENSMRIIAIFDIHMHTGKLKQIRALSEADLLLVGGDLTHFGGKGDAGRVVEKLQAYNPNILAVHGNLDHPQVDSLLDEQGISLHGRGRVINGLGLIGVGGSNPTPFATPCEYPENDIARFLENGMEELSGHQPFILLSHPPPARTKADRLRSGRHAGSTAVREFIEQNGPAFCLCGHIHESRAVDFLGSTVIINPGPLPEGGWLEIISDGDGFEYSLQPET
jgi:Icc-related predicted phosphoesterase